MDTWVQVDKLRDGDSVNSETLNAPIDQLASRTEYLKRRLGTIIEDGVQSALVLNNVDLDGEDIANMAVGMVVYKAEGGFRRAQAKMHLYDDYTADDSAFTIGILIDMTSDGKGDVLIYGKLDTGANPLLSAERMLVSGEKFRSGRYYLSANEPGKITARPGGPLIYVGSFHSSPTSTGNFSQDAFACINPQFLDIGTSHVHRAYPLVARPAGNIDETGKNVIGYLPSTHSSPDKQYPSLIFGGTWTSTEDVTYYITLGSSNTWGTVVLSWRKNGDVGPYKSVDIPASGVFVDLDNGLQVKVIFPEANSEVAFTSDLSDVNERSWTLTFPQAGKGWVNHSVDAIASMDSVNSADDSCSNTTTPRLYALLSGSWPNYNNTVYCVFPEKLSYKTLTSTNLDFVVAGITYRFTDNPAEESSSPDLVYVTEAANLEESAYNLVNAINSRYDTPVAYVDASNGNPVIFVCGLSLNTTSGKIKNANPVDNVVFNAVGGQIPVMAVFDATYTALSDDILVDVPTYMPIALTGGLSVTVYAKGATSENNYACEAGTVLKASASDYANEAVYDYVMGLHQSVDYYFPPVPAQAAGLFVNGVEMENGALFPDNPTYIVGKKTLHWMEDSVEHLPWPDGITGHDDIVAPGDDKTMAFYFSVGFQCATGPVTSLVPAPNSPLKVYTYGTTEAAYTGDLMIDADLDFKVVNSGVSGFMVAKRGHGSQLLAGPVVEKIKAGPGIIVTQADSRFRGQGTVTINLDNSTMRDHFNEVALENAKQEKLGLFPYVSLLGWGASNNVPSAFTMMMRVPTSLDKDKDYQLQLRLVMFGTNSYTNGVRRAAGVQLEYNILPDYTGDEHASLKTGLLAPKDPRQITVPIGHRPENGDWTYTAYDPFVATTEDDTVAPKQDDVCVPFSNLPIPAEQELQGVKLKPGYLVAIRISRAAPAGIRGSYDFDAYTGPLGFLSMEWSLEEA